MPHTFTRTGAQIEEIHNTVDDLPNIVSNENLISNSSFEIAGSVTNPPDATPRSYNAGDELFQGIFAAGALTGVTYIDGKANGTGQLYTDVYKSEKQNLSTANYVASIANSNGSPVEIGASFVDIGDYWRVTFDMSETFSVKFEQGGVATGHSVSLGILASGSTTPKSLEERFGETIYTSDYGVIGDGVASDTAALASAFAAAGEYGKIVLNSKLAPVVRTVICLDADGPVVQRGQVVEGLGLASIKATADGVTLLRLDSTLYATFRDFDFDVGTQENVTMMRFWRSDPSKSSPQLNKFFNINCQGRLKSGCMALALEETFTNSFFGCHFLRCNAIQFGTLGASDEVSNANHFYGCEVRGDNSNPNFTPIKCYAGKNNVFFGGVIENWGDHVYIYGGEFRCKGTYLEAFATGRAFLMNGADATLELDGCYKGNSVEVLNGHKLTIKDPNIPESTYSSGAYKFTYPMVRMDADVDIKVNISGIAPAGSPTDPDFYFFREGEYFTTGGVWNWRSVWRDTVDWMPSSLNVRASSDQLNVTGDGTSYAILLNNAEYDESSEFNNSGVFTPKQNGKYSFDVGVNIGGLEVGHRVNVKVVGPDRTFFLSRFQLASLSELSGGVLQLTGSCKLRMRAGTIAKIVLEVSNGSKSVGIMRGNAADGYTYCAIEKI